MPHGFAETERRHGPGVVPEFHDALPVIEFRAVVRPTLIDETMALAVMAGLVPAIHVVQRRLRLHAVGALSGTAFGRRPS